MHFFKHVVLEFNSIEHVNLCVELTQRELLHAGFILFIVVSVLLLLLDHCTTYLDGNHKLIQLVTTCFKRDMVIIFNFCRCRSLSMDTLMDTVGKSLTYNVPATTELV